MFPIRDVIPSRTTPVVTFCLIIANALAFLFTQFLVPADAFDATMRALTYIPADHAGLSLTLFTAMFLHAGWGHLLPNMLFLWIFGDNVEDRFGHGRFLLFYLAAGALSAWAQGAAGLDPTIPILGASGAIAAVMGAYFVLFPKSRVVMLIWLVFFIDFIEVPATLFLGFWFVLQFLGGLGSMSAPAAGGVAFFAHVGGFLVGLASGRLLARPERAELSWWDRPQGS